MVSSILLQQSINCFIYNSQLGTKLKTGLAGKNHNLNEKYARRRIGGLKIKARGAAIDNNVTVIDTNTVNSPTAFPFFHTDSQQDDTPASKLELADPEFYKIGFVRSMRAYGVEFREGPNGFGVYDITASKRAKVVMEIPLELVLTISQTTPWMFFQDIIPVGHPIFDIINSTNPEDDLKELHDENLASTMRKEKAQVLEFWERNWLGMKLINGLPVKNLNLNKKCTRPAFPRNEYEKRNAQTLANGMISLSVVPRRNLLNMSMLIMFTAPFTSTCLASPQTQEKQKEEELLDLEKYTEIKEGFTLLRPASWTKIEKAGATLLFEDPIKGSNNIGVVVTPVRLNTLSEFGDPQYVSNKLIQAEKRKESTKDVEIVSFMERPDSNVQVYEFEYKLDSTRGGLKTIFSAAFVASKKLYLLNIAHSDNPQQPLSNQKRDMLLQVLHSFDVSTSKT